MGKKRNRKSQTKATNHNDGVPGTCTDEASVCTTEITEQTTDQFFDACTIESEPQLAEQMNDLHIHKENVDHVTVNINESESTFLEDGDITLVETPMDVIDKEEDSFEQESSPLLLEVDEHNVVEHVQAESLVNEDSFDDDFDDFVQADTAATV